MKRAIVLSLLLLSGCSFFSKSQSKFFSLERIAGAAAPAARAGATPVAIDSIELPPGFDRREIVVRKADHQLEIRSADQWQASLQPLVLHTLASDLADRLPAGMVILPGAIRPAGVRPIGVVFEDLAAGPEPRLLLDARWTIGGVAHRDQIAIDLKSLGSADVATGLSQALAALADRIATGF